MTGASATPFAGDGDPATRWEPRGEVGVGGMGQVAIVFDRQLGRELAIKTPMGVADRERLRREALVTARLEHPGIVAVYDAGTRPTGEPWFAMRLVRGSSLAALLAERPAPGARARLIRHLLAAAEAVAYAHARGVVHRDLKPSNIMVGAFGETQVIDWGLALSPELPTPDPGRAGTPAAMSPEQARGSAVIDARSDVYALGAILREVVTGAPLFSEGLGREAVLAELAADRVPVPTMAAGHAIELLAIIARAMAPRPADRYPDAKALADDLARYLDGRRVSAHAYRPRELLARLLRAWSVPLAIAAIGLVVLTVVVVVAFDRVRSERDRSDRRLAAVDIGTAQRALADDSRGSAEIHARAALSRSPLEAIGILMALPAERPERTHLASLDCAPSDVVTVAGRTRVLCRSPDQVSLVAEGAVVWTVVGASDDAYFLDDGRYVVAFRDRVLDVLDSASGHLLESQTVPCGLSRRERIDSGRALVSTSSGCFMAVSRGRDRVVVEQIPLDQCRDHQMRVGTVRVASRVAGTRGDDWGPDDRWAMICDDGALVVGRLGEGIGTRFETGFPMWPAPPLVTQLVFEDDGHVLVGDDAGTLVRVALRDPSARPDERASLSLGRGMVRDIIVAPDAALAVVVSDGTAPMVVDLRRWASLGRLPVSKDARRPAIAFDPDDRFVMAHRAIERWDFRRVGAREIVLDGGIATLAVSSDGRFLATSSGHTLTVIDPVGRSVLARHRDQPGFIKTLAFGPRSLLVASPQNTLALARFDPLARLEPMATGGSFRRVVVLADGSVLGLDFSWDVQHVPPGGPIHGLAGLRASDIMASGDGRHVVALGLDHGVYRITDVHSGARTLQGIDPGALDMTVDALGTVWTVSADEVREWPVSGALGRRLSVPGADFVVVAAAADLVATGSRDGTVHVFRDGVLVAVTRVHDLRADTLVIAPDASWIASGSWDGRIVFLRRPDAVGAGDDAEAWWGLRLDDLSRD